MIKRGANLWQTVGCGLLLYWSSQNPRGRTSTAVISGRVWNIRHPFSDDLADSALQRRWLHYWRWTGRRNSSTQRYFARSNGVRGSNTRTRVRVSNGIQGCLLLLRFRFCDLQRIFETKQLIQHRIALVTWDRNESLSSFKLMLKPSYVPSTPTSVEAFQFYPWLPRQLYSVYGPTSRNKETIMESN